MFLILRPLRLLFKALVIESTPTQMSYGLALGVLLGVVPKGNLLAVVLGFWIAATRVNYFRVFDRWGKLVYESLNGEANQTLWGWDGTDRTGEKLNPAVVVYTYEIECINGDIVTGNGNVTLVR